MGDRANQIDRQRPEVASTAKDLLDLRVPGGEITEAGLRGNVSVGIQYIESWLRGAGAAAIFNLMEDAATAEISRSQIWQWVHHGAALADGRQITPELLHQIEVEELAKVREPSAPARRPSTLAATQRRRSCSKPSPWSSEFVEFLTLPAYEHLD